jgi:hypothetical protein
VETNGKPKKWLAVPKVHDLRTAPVLLMYASFYWLFHLTYHAS